MCTCARRVSNGIVPQANDCGQLAHRQLNIPSGAVVVVVTGGIAGDGTSHGDARASDGGSGEHDNVCDIEGDSSEDRPTRGMVIQSLRVNIEV